MQEQTAIPNDVPALSPAARVINTYIEPRATFTDLRRNRSWWLPLLIVVVMAYIFVGAATQHIGFDTIVHNVMRSNPRFESQTPAQQAQTAAVTKGIMQVSLAGTAVVILIFIAITALLLWVGFRFILGGSTSYQDMFAVAVFASLPGALSSLVATVAVFAGDPEHYNIAIPSPTNLAFFLEPDSAAWLRSLLSSLDLFSIWSLLLMAFGGAIVARVPPRKGILLVVGVWAAYVIIKTAASAAFS
jgi:Yip1 domain